MVDLFTSDTTMLMFDWFDLVAVLHSGRGDLHSRCPEPDRAESGTVNKSTVVVEQGHGQEPVPNVA